MAVHYGDLLAWVSGVPSSGKFSKSFSFLFDPFIILYFLSGLFINYWSDLSG
jgi:hypothetical protein